MVIGKSKHLSDYFVTIYHISRDILKFNSFTVTYNQTDTQTTN